MSNKFEKNNECVDSQNEMAEELHDLEEELFPRELDEDFEEIEDFWGYTTKTLNGARTFKSTGSDCLDLFSRVGAQRNKNQGFNGDFFDRSLDNMLVRAFVEDNNLAIKTMFYARDIREGLGERDVFRAMLKKLASLSPDIVVKNLGNIAEYGRFDDLLCLIDTPVEKQMIAFVKQQLEKDLDASEEESVSLLGKWLPSINTSCGKVRFLAHRIAAELGMSNKDYRKALAKLRDRIQIIENKLRTHDYTFDYSKQTSKAMFKYRKAFMRNDKEHYQEYFGKVKRGEEKLNTQTLYPYELLRGVIDCSSYENKALSEDEKEVINTTWKNLPDYTNNENALVVADLSGSMFCCGNPSPASVSLSLAIYFAERNKGLFANRFITFSQKPSLINIKGKDLFDKVQYCMTYDMCENTDIARVFQCILNEALKNKAKQEEMPSRIYIISDMEFDSCAENSKMTNFEYAKRLYEKNGYKLPQLVFWQVNALSNQSPVEKDERGVVLVSGSSPTIFKTAMSPECNPYQYMLDVLNSPRYERVITK